MNQWNNALLNDYSPLPKTPYRLVYNDRGDFSRFETFAAALAHSRSVLSHSKPGSSHVAIINDDLTDGGKHQGLTEEEYLEWIG